EVHKDPAMPTAMKPRDPADTTALKLRLTPATTGSGCGVQLVPPLVEVKVEAGLPWLDTATRRPPGPVVTLVSEENAPRVCCVQVWPSGEVATSPRVPTATNCVPVQV